MLEGSSSSCFVQFYYALINGLLRDPCSLKLPKLAIRVTWAPPCEIINYPVIVDPQTRDSRTSYANCLRAVRAWNSRSLAEVDNESISVSVEGRLVG